MKKEKVIVTIDVESNGLWGKPFIIGMSVHAENGDIITSFEKRCKTKVRCDWTRKNVLPHIKHIDVLQSYNELLSQFASFYLNVKSKYDCTYLMYSGHIVEANLFKELRKRNLIGYFDAPYTPIDLATVLIMNSEDPASLVTFYKKHNIKLPDGSFDTPLYDCICTFEVYKHLIKH